MIIQSLLSQFMAKNPGFDKPQIYKDTNKQPIQIYVYICFLTYFGMTKGGVLKKPYG